MADKEPYTTSDTTLAAYLLYHGHQYVGMIPDRHDRKRLVFAFIKQENTDLLYDDYWSGDPQVNPKKFHRMLKDAMNIIRDEQGKR